MLVMHALFFFLMFFFFKQKTAYEMRISDWSSDVCSSDLAVVQFETSHARALTERRGIMFDVRHALGTAGDDDVGSAGLHHHRGLDDSLEPRAATTVELKARDCLRQSGREPRPSADARRFSARIAMTEHHVVDAHGVDPAAFHERLEDRGAEDRKSTRLNSSH